MCHAVVFVCFRARKDAREKGWHFQLRNFGLHISSSTTTMMIMTSYRPKMALSIALFELIIQALLPSSSWHVKAFVTPSLTTPKHNLINLGVTNNEESSQETTKDALLRAISSTPSNSPTSKQKTNEIMALARDLEAQCPTPDEQVLDNLQGSWELMWTAQDRSNGDASSLPFRNFINPLENQAYSNNPNGSADMGRANPFLPRAVQDKLEDLGIVAQDPVRSSQTIDLKRQQVRNVVTFSVPFIGRKQKASLTLTVDFIANVQDRRRIDVKFQKCRVVVQNSPLDVTIPLGIIGPTGWLRTGYVDDTMRITRGHKGSVFVLERPAARMSKQ